MKIRDKDKPLIYAGIGLVALLFLVFIMRSSASKSDAKKANVAARVELRTYKAQEKQGRKDCKLQCKGFGLLHRKKHRACLTACMAAQKAAA
jgi:hypothetical protein